MPSSASSRPTFPLIKSRCRTSLLKILAIAGIEPCLVCQNVTKGNSGVPVHLKPVTDLEGLLDYVGKDIGRNSRWLKRYDGIANKKARCRLSASLALREAAAGQMEEEQGDSSSRPRPTGATPPAPSSRGRGAWLETNVAARRRTTRHSAASRTGSASAAGQVRAFLEAHGESRFDPAWEDEAARARLEAAGKGHRFEQPMIQRAGFRKRAGTGDDASWDFFVLPEAWRSEVCKGHDPGTIAKTLLALGHLVPGEGGKAQVKPRVPRQGTPRLYHVKDTLLEAGDGA